MADDFEQLKCVLLNINEDRLILPNAAIAEIVPVRNMINVANKPAWVLGFLDWRGNSVPLISFELLGGVRMPSLASEEVKAVVVYSVGDDVNMPFMSFLVKGAPQSINIISSDVIPNNEESNHPAIDQKVMVKGEMASIIDMERLESIIKETV